MTHEVALHAGVAVVNMVRDVFRSDFHRTGPSAQVLRLIQVAISKLRQHITAEPVVNDDGAIIAVLFLGHMASGFGDLEAFRMHRRGIKTMIESRGGLDALGLDGMLKCSVLQFESWWTHIYRDISVFASSKPSYNPVYLVAPYSAETLFLLSSLPPGFRRLAKQGKLATDILTVLSNIASYEDAIILQEANNNHPGGGGGCGLGITRQGEFVASLLERKRHADFCDACTCLLVQGPNFEKYLVLALICYVSIAFSPPREARCYLSASHTAFRTPRLLLTQELPDFRVNEENDQREPSTDDPDETEEGESESETGGAETKNCLVWIWLVLIASWRATATTATATTTTRSDDSGDCENARILERAFQDRFPQYYRCRGDWARLDRVLGRFFCTEALKGEMKRSWMALAKEE
ncbi:uncharacterized protein A1O5_13083 [Cladophialophora psammophila CBS 110553]|uniref:Transcription factor domain-containing protein n=1 Tax=Cladophialophora psammophila CBS 110553 TaxID=1182543 RepID=W9VDE5_9EURO|nr:uncharacterized protein A1O5_13083 [Cladophialophora psammophila CBS 110553]EXJ53632.1 hypothetical protein A1O5_13083 [Cladophialophora psammophila CBS 110553]